MKESGTTKQLITGAVAAASTFSVAWLSWKLLQRQRRDSCKDTYPPGPPPTFFFGNILDYPDPLKGGFPDGKDLEWMQEYGLTLSTFFPGIGRWITTADPKLTDHLLVKKNYDKSTLVYGLVTPLVGHQSIFVLNGKDWASKRRAFNPGFGPSFLRNTIGTICQKVQRLVECVEDDIKNKAPTNMLIRARVLTSDVIVTVAFGEDWGGKDPPPIRLWLSELLRLLSTIILDPFTTIFGFRRKWQIRCYEKLIDKEMMAILDRRLSDLNNSSMVDDNHKDICSLAIKNMKREDGSLTEDDKMVISHQLKTFYVAGHETTASLIAWAVWLLSQHTDTLNKLREELAEYAINPSSADIPDYDQLQKCTYLDAILKETLRMYPPVTTLARYNDNEEEVFNGFKIGGHINAINVYSIHRHPEIWKNPDEFRPERFLDESEGDAATLAAKFLPFSRGPRDCIGKYFAMLESKLTIATLALRYNVECINPHETIGQHLTTWPIDGAQVNFTKRAM